MSFGGIIRSVKKECGNMSNPKEYQKRINKWILEAVKGSERPSDIEVQDFAALYASMRVQGVYGPVYDTLKNWDPPEDMFRFYEKDCRGVVAVNYRLWFETRDIVNLLNENDIICAVLKGPSTAMYYPVPELRKSGDIDIMVLESDMERAIELAQKRGYTAPKLSYAPHEVGLTNSQKGILLELHRGMADELSDPGVNEYLQSLCPAMVSAAVGMEIIDGMTLPVLREDYHAFFLLIHMVNHFVRKGFGLKLLADWKYFFDEPFDAALEDSLLDMIKTAKIQTFTSAVTMACVKYLGADYEKMKFLCLEEISDETVDELMNEVFDSGEFGQIDKSRMILAEGSSFADLFKAFHGEMKRQHPESSKYVVTWPFLWISTYVGFVRNNKKLGRNTNTAKVVESARKRSRFNESLKILKK